MKTNNAAALCDDRHYPWCLIAKGNTVFFELRTEDGAYSLPIMGYAPPKEAGRINGDVLSTILAQARPPLGFDRPVKRG
jgi:hypothetical protein